MDRMVDGVHYITIMPINLENPRCLYDDWDYDIYFDTHVNEFEKILASNSKFWE